jgi:hypothetical protein
MSLPCFQVNAGDDQQQHFSFLVLLPVAKESSSHTVVHLKGKVRLRVVAPANGVVRCLGWAVHASADEHADIFSPKGFSLLGLKAELVSRTRGKKQGGAVDDGGLAWLDRLNLGRKTKGEVLALLKAKDSVCVVMSRLDVEWCDKLERHVGGLRLFGRDAVLDAVASTSTGNMEKHLDVNLLVGRPAAGVRYFEEKSSWDAVFRSVLVSLEKKGLCRCHRNFIGKR